MKKTLLAGAAVLLAGALAAGCTAARAVRNAHASFEQAKAAGAEQKAPYDYYAAEAYLKLAEHEAEEGDLKQARAFSRESRMHSAQAIGKTEGGAK